jgi:hypothetical protein
MTNLRQDGLSKMMKTNDFRLPPPGGGVGPTAGMRSFESTSWSASQACGVAFVSNAATPELLTELPDGSPQGNQPSAGAATLLLFEFIASQECKAGFKYKDDEKVAGGVAETAIQLPGAMPLSRPLWFDFGKQKLHATFAAFRLQNTSPDQLHALILGSNPTPRSG